MARVTVEDCLKNVKNRFELVIVAAKRARQLMRGKEPKVEWDNDKPTVVALREIAAGHTNVNNVSLMEAHEEISVSTHEIHHIPHDIEDTEDHAEDNIGNSDSKDDDEDSVAHPATHSDEE